MKAIRFIVVAVIVTVIQCGVIWADTTGMVYYSHITETEDFYYRPIVLSDTIRVVVPSYDDERDTWSFMYLDKYADVYVLEGYIVSDIGDTVYKVWEYRTEKLQGQFPCLNYGEDIYFYDAIKWKEHMLVLYYVKGRLEYRVSDTTNGGEILDLQVLLNERWYDDVLLKSCQFEVNQDGSPYVVVAKLLNGREMRWIFKEGTDTVAYLDNNVRENIMR
jgi:hypothetical protein